MNQALEVMSNARYASMLYVRAFDGVRSRYGLTQLEIDILAFLRNNPELDTASDIVRYRGLTKANVSQGVELLIRKGRLSRKADEKDRRRVHLTLTAKSESIAEEILESQKKFNEWLFRDFTEEEQELYMRMSRRLSRNIKDGMERIEHGEEK